MSKGGPNTDDRGRFRELVRDYLVYLGGVRNLSDNTVRGYGIDLDAFCDWAERQGIAPLELTHRQLRTYLSYLARARYSSKTINRHLSALRGLYRWLLREGRTTADAAAAVASPKLSKTLPETMSDQEVGRLLATCADEDACALRDRAFLELLYASGARISEISKLDLSDVDLAQGQARLFGKGSKERIVPLYDTCLAWLRRYLDEARPELARKGGGKDAKKALFLSVRGNRMSAGALRTVFERRVAQAGLDPSITPHAMRHTYATELLSGGADLRSVQELLGHASLSTTQIYTHLSVDRLKEAARQAHPRGE